MNNRIYPRKQSEAEVQYCVQRKKKEKAKKSKDEEKEGRTRFLASLLCFVSPHTLLFCPSLSPPPLFFLLPPSSSLTHFALRLRGRYIWSPKLRFWVLKCESTMRNFRESFFNAVSGFGTTKQSQLWWVLWKIQVMNIMPYMHTHHTSMHTTHTNTHTHTHTHTAHTYTHTTNNNNNHGNCDYLVSK